MGSARLRQTVKTNCALFQLYKDYMGMENGLSLGRGSPRRSISSGSTVVVGGGGGVCLYNLHLILSR